MVKTNVRIALMGIFFLAACILFYILAKKDSNYDDIGFRGHGIQLRKLNQPFEWHKEDNVGDYEAKEESNATMVNCRNSIQGKSLIADHLGYLCSRNDLLSNGCCNINASDTIRYDCSECHEATGCCKVFERCISCCMDPEKKAVLTSVLDEAKSLKNLLLLSVSDHFELCLAKCRTSSRSVQHENIYINPGFKHCYKKEPSKKPDPP